MKWVRTAARRPSRLLAAWSSSSKRIRQCLAWWAREALAIKEPELYKTGGLSSSVSVSREPVQALRPEPRLQY